MLALRQVVANDVLRVGNYLTDADEARLYRIEHVAPNGDYTLENCETEFTFQVDFAYILKLKLLKRR